MVMLPKLRRRWKGFPLSLPDSSIFVGWRCPEAHSANSVVIQTHLSRRFYLTVDFPGLRRSGSSVCIADIEEDQGLNVVEVANAQTVQLRLDHFKALAVQTLDQRYGFDINAFHGILRKLARIPNFLAGILRGPG